MPELVCAADDPRWREERRAGVTATDIDDALYRAWLNAKSSADHWTKTLKHIEATIRDQTGGAKTVTVDGQPVARRITREAKNVTWTSDHYRHLGGKDDDDD